MEALKEVVRQQQNEKMVFCYKYKTLHAQYMEMKAKYELEAPKKVERGTQTTHFMPFLSGCQEFSDLKNTQVHLDSTNSAIKQLQML